MVKKKKLKTRIIITGDRIDMCRIDNRMLKHQNYDVRGNRFTLWYDERSKAEKDLHDAYNKLKRDFGHIYASVEKNKLTFNNSTAVIAVK